MVNVIINTALLFPLFLTAIVAIDLTIEKIRTIRYTRAFKRKLARMVECEERNARMDAYEV